MKKIASYCMFTFVAYLIIILNFIFMFLQFLFPEILNILFGCVWHLDTYNVIEVHNLVIICHSYPYFFIMFSS